MTTSSANQQQISISARQAGFEDNVSVDSILASVSAPRKTEHFSVLQEDMQNLHNVGGQDVPNIQALHHPIPEPREVGATSPRGVAPNQQILLDEQLDIEAVRTLLGLPILHNAITVRHYWRIVMSLRDKLLLAGPDEIPYGEAFARILLRLAGRLVLAEQSSEYRLAEQSSEYSLSFRPLGFAECLEKLQYAITEGFVVKQQTGMEDDVYIIKDKQLYIENLNSLASRLRGF